VTDRLPGEFVLVDGDLLHVVVEGSGTPGTTGTPPVLLSSGLGGAWFDWMPVIERLGDRRVIVFDRPGLGGSPPARQVAALREEAGRLAGLARWAGAPVDVVAHSMAGFHAEAFARLYPELVGGMVLVDPSAEPYAPRYARWLSRLVPVAGYAGRVPGLGGVLRLSGPRLRAVVLRRISERGDLAPPELSRSVYTKPHVLGAFLAEQAGYRQQAADLLLLRESAPFPDIPLGVITALGDVRGDGSAWTRAHADLAALSPRGWQVVLPRAGHLVPIDRPEAVADAVAEVVRRR
jgi:pimeloyl-ACP methyl ester carboxylesterase